MASNPVLHESSDPRFLSVEEAFQINSSTPRGKAPVPHSGQTPYEILHAGKRSPGTRSLGPRWRAVMAFQMRGFTNEEIARQVRISPGRIGIVTRTERYQQEFEARLKDLDNDFLAMKPLALEALKSGLKAADANTALRASDQFFKVSGYMGYGKQQEAPNSARSEDVARQLIALSRTSVHVHNTVVVESPSAHNAQEVRGESVPSPSRQGARNTLGRTPQPHERLHPVSRADEGATGGHQDYDPYTAPGDRDED